MALHYEGEAQHFAHWQVQGVLLEDFPTHVAAAESISLHWEFDCELKTKNGDPAMHTA